MTDRLVAPRKEGVTEAAESTGKAKRVPAGSLLLSFKLSVGRVGIAASDVFPNEAIAWIKPRGMVTRDFLALALERADWDSYGGRAVKGKTLNSQALDSVRLALPPLAEQRRIVSVVGGVDAALAESKRAREATERALSSISDAAWANGQLVPLARIGTLVTGATPPTSRKEYWSDPTVPFITPADIRWTGSLIRNTGRLVSASALADSRRPLVGTSVVQVCIGATAGKVGIFHGQALFNQQINAVVDMDSDEARVLAAMLSSQPFQHEFRRSAGTSTLPLVSKSLWAKLKVSWPAPADIPPLAATLRSLDQVVQSYESQCDALRASRASVLDTLLSGGHEIPESYDALLVG